MVETNNRGKDPSANTVRILCGKAAGMCQFRGCDKRLFYDNVSLKEFNNSYVAHIVAASPNGPRGDEERSFLLSDKIENLMLMCSDHHHIIDTCPDEYPEDKLLQMKHEHEVKMDTICSIFNVPCSELLFFSSPIKGKDSTHIDTPNATKAILPRRQPSYRYGNALNIESSYDYKSSNYWDDTQRQLKQFYENKISTIIDAVPDVHFSVFPLAPIPLISKLGEMLGDKISIDVYQKTRVPDDWNWQSQVQTNHFNLEILKGDVGPDIALILSLTNDIEVMRIPKNINVNSIYKIKASKHGVDCIASEADLSVFWHLYQSACELILNDNGRDCTIHIFPAIPVSAAFEIGRRYMKGVYPLIKMYDYDEGFFETLRIGE